MNGELNALGAHQAALLFDGGAKSLHSLAADGMQDLDLECRRLGGEAIAAIYSTADEVIVSPVRNLSMAERELMFKVFLPAALEVRKKILAERD